MAVAPARGSRVLPTADAEDAQISGRKPVVLTTLPEEGSSGRDGVALSLPVNLALCKICDLLKAAIRAVFRGSGVAGYTKVKRRQRLENVSRVGLQDARLSRNFECCKGFKNLAIARPSPTQTFSSTNQYTERGG
jgi:hypothetical protein